MKLRFLLISLLLTPLIVFSLGAENNSDMRKEKETIAHAIIMDTSPSFWVTEKNEIIAVSGVLFFALISAIIYLAITRRGFKRSLEVFESFSGIMGVTNNSEKLLFFNSKDIVQNFSKIKYLKDIPNLDYPKVSSAVAKVFQSKQPLTTNYTFQNFKRSLSLVPLKKEIFGIDAVAWISLDNSELQESLERQQELSERFSSTLKSIGDGVIVTDDKGNITMINSVAERLLGYKQEEVVGVAHDKIFNIVSYVNNTPQDSPLNEALTLGHSVELKNHTDLISKDGTRRHIADSASPIKNGDGKILGAILVFRDVTKEYNQRDEIFRKNRLLKNATEIANMTYFSCDSSTAAINMSVHSDFPDSHFWAFKDDGTLVDRRDWIIPEDYENYISQWKSLLAGEVSSINIMYRSDYTGSRNYFRMVVAAQENELGENEFFGVIQDITKSKQNEFEINDVNQMLNSILDNLPCYVFVKNFSDNDRYIVSNKYNEERSTRNGISVKGKTDFELYDAQTAAQYVEADRKVVESGGVFETIERTPSKDGELTIGKTVKITMKSAAGDTYLIGLSLDVTELYKTQETLKSYVEQEKIVNEILKLIVLENSTSNTLCEISRAIGRQIQADRCYIFENVENDMSKSNVYEWHSNDTVTKKSGLSKVPSGNMSQWISRLKTEGVIKIDDIENENDILPSTKELLKNEKIQSLICVSVWHNGKVWGFIGIDFVRKKHKFTDIDKRLMESASAIVNLYLERSLNIERLVASEAQKNMIIESMQTPILLFDANRNLLKLNSAAVKMVGKDAKTILSEPCHKNICKGMGISEGGICPVVNCLSTKKQNKYEIKNESRTLCVTTYPIHDKNGEIVNVLESFIDVTEYKEANKTMEKAVKLEQEANRAKSYFLATMSHELRTPLNAVIGYSELSQDADLPNDELIENLKNINFSANVLLTLINDILDLSKIEAEQVEITKSPMNLKLLTEEMLKIFKFRAEKQGIKLFAIIEENLPILELDSIRIKQVLINIMGNAVKFTDNGSVTVKVGFTANKNSDDSGTLCIQIIDTGMGIEKESIGSIFNPFMRQSESRVRGHHAYEGTGLGLPISLGLAKKMGGRIDVESEIGVGTKFSIILENVKIAKQIPTEVARVCDETANLPEKTFSKKVLIVDDVEMNLKVLGAILKKLNIEYVACSNGNDALEEFKRHNPPEVVLTDLWMPNMSGEDLAKILKSNGDTAKIPVIAVTADTQIVAAPNLFDGVLLKPITRDNVRKTLKIWA